MELANFIRNPKYNMGNCQNESRQRMELVVIIVKSKYNMEIVKENPNCPWDWNYLSTNKNITWKLLRKIQTVHGIGNIYHIIKI